MQSGACYPSAIVTLHARVLSCKVPEVSEELPRGCRRVPLQIMGDERGSLIAIERRIGLPFDVQRVYFIFDTAPGVTRGLHAHRNLKQWLVCVSGALTLTLDDGRSRVSLQLDRPDEAIEIDGLVWREMANFSAGAVLLVLASRPWEPSDYIRDYGAFAELAGK